MDTNLTAKSFFDMFNPLENDLAHEHEAKVKELEAQLKGVAWAGYKVAQEFLKTVEAGTQTVDAKYGERMALAIIAAQEHVAAVEAVQKAIRELKASAPNLRAPVIEEPAPKTRRNDRQFSGVAVMTPEPKPNGKVSKGHGEVAPKTAEEAKALLAAKSEATLQ